jgi:hypothetical protein
MPLKAIDFSKTIIYKIWKDDDFYVGSTTDFASRKSRHKHNSNNEKSHNYNFKLYQIIREKGGWNEWQMTPLEEYVECQNKTQARIREEKWRIELNASLNTIKAFITKETRQEYQKQYYKQYRQEHIDDIKKYNAKKFECECGSVSGINDKARHEKTKKHQTYLATL